MKWFNRALRRISTEFDAFRAFRIFGGGYGRLPGEEITYQYDTLNRLISAQTTGPEWGQSFGYDGFGNLLSQTVTKGSAPSLSVTVDPTTNRITNSSGDSYVYDAPGQRVSKTNGSTMEYYFYGVDGNLLYKWPRGNQVYFGRNLIYNSTAAVVTDRLGSVVQKDPTTTRYFPYGDEPSTTEQNRPKFATYFRDGTTALDYAQQRYYASTLGRFTSPDPYQASGGPADPQSWNRYAYVQNDPVNAIDRTGLRLDHIVAADGDSGGVLFGIGSDSYYRDVVPEHEGWRTYYAPVTFLVPGRGAPPQPKPQPPPCPPVPQAPTGADLLKNLQVAEEHKASMLELSKQVGGGGFAPLLAGELVWFYNQVRNNGPWDYKQAGPGYEAFGNFNFGATGGALGIDLETLLRSAGWAQRRAGTSRREWNIYYGKPPYGDDPQDQAQIRAGFEFYSALKVLDCVPIQ